MQWSTSYTKIPIPMCKTKINYIKSYLKIVIPMCKKAINYIKIFHNAKALEISVGNSYTEDHTMHTLLEKLQQGGK